MFCLCCKHDGTDNGTTPAVIRPARHQAIGLITDRQRMPSVL